MAAIELRHLRLSFFVENQCLEVLKDVNLIIPERKITVLLGKSGCGKTSLLRIVQGLEKNYQGEISWHNNRCTMVFQEPRLFPWLTVKKNIAFGNAVNEEEMQCLLKKVGLTSFSNAFPHQLSGGMRARVALARALARPSDFLLMDEPFASLDAFTSEKLQKELQQLYLQQKMGILFVTHSIDEALRLGHKIVVLSEGKVLTTYEIEEEVRDLLSEKFIVLKRSILENIRRS